MSSPLLHYQQTLSQVSWQRTLIFSFPSSRCGYRNNQKFYQFEKNYNELNDSGLKGLREKAFCCTFGQNAAKIMTKCLLSYTNATQMNLVSK